MRLPKYIIYFLFLVTLSVSAHPVFPIKKNANAKQFLRISVSPLIGFYSINTKHAVKPSQRMSGVFSIRHELKLDRSNKLYFLYGADYLIHGLNFRSYYFKPDSIQLYTKQFDYTYSLYIQEANIPLQMRLSFKNEKNAVVSPYVTIGYHLRFITTANLLVTQNGNKIVSEGADVKFKTPIFFSKLNSGINVSFGIQKNPVNSALNGFVELTYRYGFSPYYFEKAYSANSLIMNSSFLGLNLGVRF